MGSGSAIYESASPGLCFLICKRGLAIPMPWPWSEACTSPVRQLPCGPPMALPSASPASSTDCELPQGRTCPAHFHQLLAHMMLCKCLIDEDLSGPSHKAGLNSHQETFLSFPSPEASCSPDQGIPGGQPGVTGCTPLPGSSRSSPYATLALAQHPLRWPSECLQCPEHAEPRLSPTAFRAQTGDQTGTRPPQIPIKNL